ncbi:MAG: hypothetical protein ACI4IG_02795 [Eubacterium sp.]
MTSTKSAYKSNFLNVFKKTFRQRLVNIIFILAVSVLAPILFFGYEVLSIFDDYGKYNETENVLILLGFMVIACGFFSLSIAPKMFKEIYKKQSCDLFFSLPIKRKDYFFAKYTLGALVNIAAFVLSGCVSVLLFSTASTEKLTYFIDYGTLIQTGLAMLLALLATYTSFVMCAVIAGKRIHYIFLSIICLLFTGNFINGFVAPLNYIWGYQGDQYLVSALSPIYNVIYAFSLHKNIFGLCIISVIEIIGMLILGYISFKKRKAEVAEMNISGNVTPYIILAVFTTSVFMAYSSIGNFFTAVIAGVILSGLLGMAFSGLFYKKVYTKKTGTTVIAVCLACTIFLSAVYLPSHNGYVKKIPSADEIESIELCENEAADISVGLLGSIAPQLSNYYYDDYYYYYDEYPPIKVESEEGIKAILELHEKLVDDETIKNSKNINTFTLFQAITDDYYYGNAYSCQLKYTLKNGKTMVRSYCVKNECILDEIVNVFKTEEAFNQLIPFSISPDNMLYVVLEDNDYSYDGGTVIDSEAFLEAYRKDLLAMDNKKAFINEINCNYKISSGDYSSEDYLNELGGITVYYIRDNASDSIRRELKGKRLDEIVDYAYGDEYYMDYYDYDYYYDYDTSHNYELCEAIGSDYIYYTKEFKNVIDLVSKYENEAKA